MNKIILRKCNNTKILRQVQIWGLKLYLKESNFLLFPSLRLKVLFILFCVLIIWIFTYFISDFIIVSESYFISLCECP